MMTEEVPPGNVASPYASDLSANQVALLRDFSGKAGRPALNRPFKIVGAPPARSLERPNLVIETNITDEELLGLARSGYLEYKVQDGTIAFRERAYFRRLQVDAMPVRHVGPDGIRLGKVSFAFGKYRTLTVVRIGLILAAVVLLILYVAGLLNTTTVQTWAAVGGVLIAALALQAPQRGN